MSELVRLGGMYDPNNDTRGSKERAYDEHISPLMTEIIALCKSHGIPMLATFALDFDEEHGSDLYCTTCLVDDDKLKPSDDRIARARAIIRPPPPTWAAFIEYPDGKLEKVGGSDN